MAAALLAGCGGSAAATPPIRQTQSAGALTTADQIGAGGCAFSVDGLVWYAVPSGVVPPFDYSHLRCAGVATTGAGATPPIPSWARPRGPTQTIFVATSLQETYSLGGMQAIAGLAHAAGLR